jgi:hypothetical protein
MAAIVSGRQTASGEQRGAGVAPGGRVVLGHATNGTYVTHGTYGADGGPRDRPREFRGARGYLHLEAPSIGHFETLGEYSLEDEDENDYSGFAAVLAPAADQTDHNALNDQFMGGDQIGIQRVLGL